MQISQNITRKGFQMIYRTPGGGKCRCKLDPANGEKRPVKVITEPATEDDKSTLRVIADEWVRVFDNWPRNRPTLKL